MQRIKRMRGCESGIDENYIHSIHDIYEKWIHSIKDNNDTNIKIHMINGNQDKEVVLSDVKKTISSII